jgi:hypothetical protein
MPPSFTREPNVEGISSGNFSTSQGRNNDPSLGTLRGMFVAQSIKPQARTLAESCGITCVEVDYDALRGRESNTWTLFI